MMRNFPRFFGILPFLFLPACFGQAAAREPVEVYTVCDIIRDLPAFNGKEMAILGRMLFTMEGAWLTADDCGVDLEALSAGLNHFMKLNNSVWLLATADDYDSAGHMPSINPASLAKKLKQAAATTKIGTHDLYVCTDSTKPDGKRKCVTEQEDDEWAIAYGRVDVTSESPLLGGFSSPGGSSGADGCKGSFVLPRTRVAGGSDRQASHHGSSFARRGSAHDPRPAI